MKLLARTPEPRDEESLFPYMLRLSEANCYRSPLYLAYTANVSRTHWLRPYPSYPAMMLAPLIGGYEEALARMGYSTVVGNAVHFKLLDHDLGRDTTDLMRLRRPALCVECVKEEGHIRGFWDLAAAVACPRHGRLGVERCHTCHKPLAWYRPGLLMCRCNADIGMMTTPSADETLSGLMKVLDAKVDRRSLSESQVASDFPLRSIDAMPLLDFIRVIQVLGEVSELAGSEVRKQMADSASTVSSAAALLLEWPKNLDRWFESVQGTHAARVVTRAINRIDTGLFRRKPLSDGMRQLKDAVRPVLRARQAAVDASPSTAKGRRGPKTDEEVRHTQTAFREAVARFGIPASTLFLLRSRGTYKSEVQEGRRQQWMNAELAMFSQRLLALAAEKGASPGAVRLKALLRRKFRNAVLKAELVEAVLQGALPVVGLGGDTPGDLLLEADAARKWVQEARLREGKGTITMAEAACEIDLCPPAIPAAISAGLLEAVVVDDVTRVTLASVSRFRERYVPIVQLARGLNTSVRRLTRFVEGHGVQVVRLKRAGVSNAEQPIMHRASERKVEALWAEERVLKAGEQSPRIHPGPKRSRALAAYLEAMKKKGEPLPRRAGHLDKSKIARACGFERNEFYARPELAKLLDDAVAGLASLKPADLLCAYLVECSRPGKRIPRNGAQPNRRAIAEACGFDRGEFYKDQALGKLLDDVDLAEQNRKVEEPLTPIESLRSYLAHCSRSGKPIPRIRGKPNKTAIAVACGLSRHFLDRHPVAERLLAQIPETL